ncbi:ABC transporter permease subunit [Plesiomonas shigelloides]|nr:ABC transporter permease subunit [Plesiomonas shigelloides]
MDMSVMSTLKQWSGKLTGLVGRGVLLLFTVALGSFTLLSLSPVDPVRAYIGMDALRIDPEQYAKIAARWGLDQPAWSRFLHWLSNILQGDLGFSQVYNAPVAEVISDRFLTSLGLLAGAWLLSGVLGFALGVLAGRRKDSLTDKLICALAYIMASLPAFWIGLLLLSVFAVQLAWAPVCCALPMGMLPEQATWTMRLQHMILPMLTLSLIGTGNIILHTRARLIEIMQSEFVRFARSQGDGGLPLLRFHLLRHISAPALCLQFASFGELFGGSVLVEKVFAYPGLGQATIDAGLRADVPLLLGIALFSALFVFTGNQIAEWWIRSLDPRLAKSRPQRDSYRNSCNEHCDTTPPHIAALPNTQEGAPR